MLIKIEEGKFYRTQSGKKVGPAHPIYDSTYCWNVPTETGGFLAYDDYGNICLADRDWDIKEEWLDADTPTLYDSIIANAEAPKREITALYIRTPLHRKIGTIELIDGEPDLCSIKPEPKRETVTLHGCGFYWEQAEQPCPSDTHRITFDTIDGEPDPTRIKMEKL